jgi:hypothetical protein
MKSPRIGPISGDRFSDNPMRKQKARASDRKVETGFRTHPMRKQKLERRASESN